MSRLQAGSATADVTPDDPVPLSGYGARDGPSEGVHDPIAARSLVVTDGDRTVAVVSVDLLNVSRELVADVRGDLADEGVGVDEILLAATHTHGAPYLPSRTFDAFPGLRVDDDVSDYVALVRDGIVESVRTAHERLEPATIRVGRAENDRAAVNRRAAGGVSGNVRMPHGPVDPELVVLLVETVSGDETVVFNYACHPVCTTPNEQLVTADWPGYVYDRVAEERGARAIFLNGAAGDVNPAGKPDDASGDAVYAYMERIGNSVADTVLEAADDAERASPVQATPLRTRREDLRLPVRSTPPRDRLVERVEELEQTLDGMPPSCDAERGRVWEDLKYVQGLLAVADWDATHVPTPIQSVELGNVGLVGMPGEPLVAYGLELKEAATVETLCPVGYVGEWVGYLPQLSDLDNGGYEVRMTRVSPEGLVEFREAVLDLVEDGGSIRRSTFISIRYDRSTSAAFSRAFHTTGWD